jgi:hypothetical protein
VLRLRAPTVRGCTRRELGAVFEQASRLSFEQGNALVVSEVFGRLDAQASLPGLVEIINAWRPDLALREP